MKNAVKNLFLLFVLTTLSGIGHAQMTKSDLENACSKITPSTHSHFNLVHNNNVDKFEIQKDFKLEFKENVMIIHNGLNEIHVSYAAIHYVSVGKPDKANSELKAQWFIMF